MDRVGQLAPIFPLITMEQYRKNLDQNVTQTQTELNSFLPVGKPEGLLLCSTSTTPVDHRYEEAAQSKLMIEDCSEAEGKGSFRDETQSYDTPSQSDNGNSKNKLSRYLRRLIPSSMGNKANKLK
jgi:hypothetical protein